MTPHPIETTAIKPAPVIEVTRWTMVEHHEGGELTQHILVPAGADSILVAISVTRGWE